MRFLAPATLLLLAAAQGSLALAAPGEETNQKSSPQQVAARSPHMEKRQCSYDGCRCDSRGRQFRSCGNCVWTDTGGWVITAERDLTHVYECAPDGSCCDYGFAADCGGAEARCYLQ